MEPIFKHGTVICYSCKNNLTGTNRECYACEKGLVGLKKSNRDEEWHCECTTWDCKCKECDWYYCPMCNSYFPEHEGLSKAKAKITEGAYWLANMVTHYRHNHIKSWNKMWSKRTGGYYRDSFGYDDTQYKKRKEEINERAKRQIIRKGKDYLMFHNITSKQFMELLKGMDEATLKVAREKLDNVKG